MTPAAVLLLIVSAGLHAGWNLITKRSRPTASFFLVANTVGGLLLVPVVVLPRHVRCAAWVGMV